MAPHRLTSGRSGTRTAATVVTGLTVLLALVFVFVETAPAASAKSVYLQADKCYRSLLKQPKRQKYRHNWFSCINKFKKAYKIDPDGPWAAASLYKAAQLYFELYGHSHKKSDKQEAVDLYQRIVKRYPKSRYRARAEKELKSMHPAPAAAPAKASAKKSVPAQERAYAAAETCYSRLSNDPKKRKFRHHWLRCIKKYRTAYAKDPAGARAAASLYKSGNLYLDLYRYSSRTGDREKALEMLARVASRYPQSPYAARAELKLKKKKAAPRLHPVPKPPPPIPPPSTVGTAGGAAPAAAGASTVTGLRYWSNPRYTRIVIDATRETGYSHKLLKKDPSIGKPQRLYIDFDGSRLKSGVQREVPINDNLLIDARAGQYTRDVVRVVVDIKSFENYKVFSLRNPFRVVIDVWGKRNGAETASREKAPPVPLPSGKSDLPPSALAKQLALGVRRIVIDPGHGGKDYGAPGYFKGVHEKDVVLALGKRLARKIRKELGCEVTMTRTSNRYLTLEERTAIANTKNADLFISIHTNAHRKQSVYGIETFFLNLATDDDAIRVAARENATSTKNISDLETILSDLMQNAKINESSRLAANVQTSIYRYLKPRYSKIKSKGVKQAPFYVLLGAQMPAILIETSFISNKRECKRLTDPKYQEHLCDGIIKGIRGYIREISPATAFNHPAAGDRG